MPRPRVLDMMRRNITDAPKQTDEYYFNSSGAILGARPSGEIAQVLDTGVVPEAPNRGGIFESCASDIEVKGLPSMGNLTICQILHFRGDQPTFGRKRGLNTTARVLPCVMGLD